MNMSDEQLKISGEWQKAAEEIKNRPGPILVIGAQDSGKTTFSIYLAEQMCRAGRKVAWIDLDPGRPHVGLPGTISLTPFTRASDLFNGKTPLVMSFIGDTSPVGRLLDMLSGIKKLVERTGAYAVDVILINTCDLVSGGAARELRFHEIDIIAPTDIVALQKENEVEHLLAPHAHRGGLLIHRVPTSPNARSVPSETRRAVRERRFKEYFRGADFQEIFLHDVGIHGQGLGAGERLGFRDINILSKIFQAIVVHAELSTDRLYLLVEGEYAETELFTAREQYGVREVMVQKRSELDHLLIGLNDDRNFCLGLGILLNIDVKDLIIRVITPLKDISCVRYISFGSIRVSPAGQELGRA
jgi:polynucleotide 5'-hydroxyl-kinase GRC3/NOL9